MRLSLAKEYAKFKTPIKEAVQFFTKNKYSPTLASLYCAGSGLPIYVLYYTLYKELNVEGSLEYCKDLCDFYQMDFDLEE